MKDITTIAIVVSVLGFSIYNAWTDSNEIDEHHQFFQDVTQFMKDTKRFNEETKQFKAKGGRNTSDMGKELCIRLNILEFHSENENKELMDCDDIYK